MRRLLKALLAGLFAVSLLLGGSALAQELAETLRGTLRDAAGEPVEGVAVTVARDGSQVGRDISDGQGVWEVALPGPGDYTVTLDEETLPEGVGLRNPDGATLDAVTVRPGQQRTVIFPLGEGGSSAPRVLRQLAQLAVEGVKLGVIIAITAIGLSLVFGTTRLINFAHGELVTLGATFAFLFNASAAGPRLQLIPAAALSVALGGVVGAGLDRGLWRPLRTRGTGLIQMFIISIGLSLLLRHLILILFGSRARPYADYTLQQALQLGPVALTPRDLVVIVLSFVVLGGVGLLLQRTRVGKAMRAVADNRDLAESSGIDVERVVLTVWILGGALAALGGVFFGLVEVITWDMGFNLLLLMFAGVILGGLGTAFGAMVGSLLVGLVAQLSTAYFPVELRNAWALAVLIVVLLLRPQGILGQPQRIG
ncbi:MAG TPA: carboxypeptidase regulatory-like domain-containing protein [Egibacteraceae bacterium]|nr:carboxypeptidase regulatory-like domain-containing protein [Actinomycetota bacterium]HWB72868.1 carboxypeptidase regulatory-like domain-containing protein [Egibacteraceae bacterium]